MPYICWFHHDSRSARGILQISSFGPSVVPERQLRTSFISIPLLYCSYPYSWGTDDRKLLAELRSSELIENHRASRHLTSIKGLKSRISIKSSSGSLLSTEELVLHNHPETPRANFAAHPLRSVIPPAAMRGVSPSASSWRAYATYGMKETIISRYVDPWVSQASQGVFSLDQVVHRKVDARNGII